MKRAKLIFAFFVLLAVYHAAGAIWGDDAKHWFFGGMLLVSALCWVVSLVLTRWLRQSSSDTSARTGRAFDAGIDLGELFATPGPRLRGSRRHLDGLLAVLTLIGGLLCIDFFGGQRLAWDAPFTGWHIVSMIISLTFYGFLRVWLWRGSQ